MWDRNDNERERSYLAGAIIFGDSFNGRTADFESVNQGSNPWPPANRPPRMV